MANGKLLRQLIKTGAAGNTEAFCRITEDVIREERRKQHHLLADDLEKILYSRLPSSTNSWSKLGTTLPNDRERGIPLLELLPPKRGWDDVILSEENQRILETILQEHHRVDLLQSYGLHPTNRLLFYGPPGCGKTLTAEVIATELNYPLVIVRLDSVVSSFLGETAANLRQVFDFIQSRPMVALFDEFDALAKERSEKGDHGELKRVVNAVLQMMDAYKGPSLMIAATNHEAILDSAIWRRFEEVLVFDLPTSEQLKTLLKLKLRGIRRNFSLDALPTHQLFNSLSHADVERILQRAIKMMILSNQELLGEIHIKAAWDREQARFQRLERSPF